MSKLTDKNKKLILLKIKNRMKRNLKKADFPTILNEDAIDDIVDECITVVELMFENLLKELPE